MMRAGLLLRLTEASVLLALLVVLLGGWTRLNDAGLSCPDWPGCYGELVIPGSDEARTQAQLRYPDHPLDPRRGWIEMSHRYLAGSLGLLIAVLAAGGWRYRRQPGYPVRLGFGLLGLVVLQALFGMWTVTLKLLPQVVTLHLLGGVLTLALLLRLRQRLGAWAEGLRFRPLGLRAALAAGLLLLFVQIGLGGWTSANYAGWSCSHWWQCELDQSVKLDFDRAFELPEAHQGSYLGGHLQREARAAIQMSHRGIGLLVAAYLIGLAVVLARRQQRVKAGLLAAALIGQLALGVLNVVHGLPLLLAMAHHAGAVLLLVVLVWIYGGTGFRREVLHG